MIFYIILPKIISQKPSVSCIYKHGNDYSFLIAYLGVGTILMHFLPIFVITNMYKVGWE